MSAKFFQSVRRNQKQWMVVLTVLSMVSFLFLDSLVDRGRSPLTPMHGAMLIGILFGAGMCIVGYPRQKTTEYGVGGFAVGFIAGLLGFSAMGVNKPVVRTAAGAMTRKDFEHLARNRAKVNQFLSAVSRKAQTAPQGFGGVNDEALVYFQLLQADAHKMGIRVSDERVNEYLKQVMQGRLTKSDYEECLREARLGKNELFDLLKEELSIQLVMELTKPPSYLPPIPQGFAQFIRESPQAMSYMQPTPYQLWSIYQKLNVKGSLLAVAVPTRDFTTKVGEPTEIELTAFFDKFKGRMWNEESQPGFLLPPRVQLAYVTADFEKFEKGPDPTDEEVRQYYEANKDRYRAPMPKESTAPKLPEGDNGLSAPDTTDEKMKDEVKAPAPESGAKEQPATDDGAKEKKEEKPAAEDKKPPADEKPADDPKSKCGEEPAEKAPEAKPEAKPEPDKPESDKPAAEEKPAAAEEKPATEPKSDPAIPKLNTSPESLPGPKFRDLDEDLKLEIREEILRERAFVKIGAELDRAKEFMVNLGLDYDTVTDKDEKSKKAKSVAEQLKKYAIDHNLEYVETALLSYSELDSDPLGLAFEAKSRVPVAQELFSPGPRGESRVPLYSPHRADLKSHRGAFAYWKISELPAEIANLKDDAIHAKAVSAWKFDQARSLAEKRAAELLKKIKAEGNDMPAALAGESVTGEKTDPAITIIQTDPFTWLTTNRSVPGAPQDPLISRIPLIDNIGNNFMKTVFEDLNEGDVAVIADEPRSVFYVVKVINRETAHDDDGGVARHERQQKFMKEEFSSKFYPLMKSPYQALAHYPQQQIDQQWRKNFEQSHQVNWEESAIQVRRGE